MWVNIWMEMSLVFGLEASGFRTISQISRWKYAKFSKIVNIKNLKIPHFKCHLRNFVLYPIKEIDEEWTHPILKKNVKFLINKLDQKSRIEITRLNKNVIIKL